MARPSDYTPELAKIICDQLSEGIPLAEICRAPDMPHPSTVRRWADKDKAVSLAIADAREDGEERIAADCLAIADDARNDWMEKFDKDGGSVGYQLNGDHVQRSKLRIETRLKLLAKWNPKKYGDKQELTGRLTLSHEKSLEELDDADDASRAGDPPPAA